MPNIIRPRCLSRRYEALDQLIQDLAITNGLTPEEFSGTSANLMRQFWDILNENDDSNIESSERFSSDKTCNDVESSEIANCCGKSNENQSNDCSDVWGDMPSEPLGDMDLPCSSCPLSLSTVILRTSDPYSLNRHSCRITPNYSGECSQKCSPARKVDEKKSVLKTPVKNTSVSIMCNHGKQPAERKPFESSCPPMKPKTSFVYSSEAPICCTLGKLREVDSMTKKCNKKIDDMISTTKILENRMVELEAKERNGVKLMQEADRMWSAMENCYKKKLRETLQRQEEIMKEIESAEKCVVTCRKFYQENEDSIKKIEKLEKDTVTLRKQKNADAECMQVEIDNLEKTIANYTQSMITAAAAMEEKQLASAVRMKKNIEDALRLENELLTEQRNKKYIEIDGNRNLKTTRKNLNNLSNTLFSKNIENKEIKYQQESIIKDIDLLRDTKDQCKDRCLKRDKYIHDEIKSLNSKIADFSTQCIQCHQSIDTDDVRKYCSDCPQCLEQRTCLIKDGFCKSDPRQDCVCMSVKQRFLDNIFDNMYSVLEINSQSKTSNNMADKILESLQKSRNGKLDEETRKQIQNFILKTVKRNLNGILVGGAVKTRCEMDAETYNQLMMCLTKITVKWPETSDKGIPKGQPCTRWGGANDCMCSKDKSGACRCDTVAPKVVEPAQPASSDKSNSKSKSKSVQSATSCCENKDTTKRSRSSRKGTGNYCSNARSRGNQCIHRHEIVSRPESIMSVEISKSYNSIVKSSFDDMKEIIINKMKSHDDIWINENKLFEAFKNSIYKLGELETVSNKDSMNKKAINDGLTLENYIAQDNMDVAIQKHSEDEKIGAYFKKLQSGETIELGNQVNVIKKENYNKDGSKFLVKLEEQIINKEHQLNRKKNTNGVEIIRFNSSNIVKIKNETNSFIKRKITEEVVPISENDNVNMKSDDNNSDNAMTSEKSNLSNQNHNDERKRQNCINIPIKISENSPYHMTTVYSPKMKNQLLLKQTSSNNYLIILNKEFEKSCKSCMIPLLGKIKKCEIRLQKDESGLFVVHTHFENPIPNNEMAYVFVTKSGQIKITLYEPLTNISTYKTTNPENHNNKIKKQLSQPEMTSFPSCDNEKAITPSNNDTLFPQQITSKVSQTNMKILSQQESKLTSARPETERAMSDSEMKILSILPEVQNKSSHDNLLITPAQEQTDFSNSTVLSKITNSQSKLLEDSVAPFLKKVNRGISGNQLTDLLNDTCEKVLKISDYNKPSNDICNTILQTHKNDKKSSVGIATSCNDSCDRSKCLCDDAPNHSSNGPSCDPTQCIKCRSSTMREAIKCTCKKLGWNVSTQLYRLNDIVYDRHNLPPMNESTKSNSLNETESCFISEIVSNQSSYCNSNNKFVSPTDDTVFSHDSCKSITLRNAILEPLSNKKNTICAVNDRGDKLVTVNSLEELSQNMTYF